MRQLRNEGAEVVGRVERGEPLIVTRDGVPVAELRPLTPPALGARAVLERFRGLASIDPDRFRADVDRCVDQSL